MEGGKEGGKGGREDRRGGKEGGKREGVRVSERERERKGGRSVIRNAEEPLNAWLRLNCQNADRPFVLFNLTLRVRVWGNGRSVGPNLFTKYHGRL